MIKVLVDTKETRHVVEKKYARILLDGKTTPWIFILE